MNTILGIDPGSSQSGYAIWHVPDQSLVTSGVADNQELMQEVINRHSGPIVIELTPLYPMKTAGGHAYVPSQVGDTMFETGRFHEYILQYTNVDPVYIKRSEVLKNLEANKRNRGTKDSQVIAMLTQRLGSKGTKANPGPLFGIASHAWQALAVAITAIDQNLI